MRWCIAATLVYILVAFATPAAQGGSDPGSQAPERVTVIGDSVLTAVFWNGEPLDILEQGRDVRMEVEVCRRLMGESCPFEGNTAPTLLDTVQALGPQLAPTVVVEVGYNDFEDTFDQSVEQSISALLGAGAKHILWLNLREVGQSYVHMNSVLTAAARRHPEVTIVDWNSESRDHSEWFQNDGIHLVYPGAIGIARLIHNALDQPAAPPPTVAPQQAPPTQHAGGTKQSTPIGQPALRPLTIAESRPPTGQVGRRYLAVLTAHGGVAPFTWTVTSGSLPTGLHLKRFGQISGTAVKPARTSFVVSVTDARGAKAVHREVLVIRKRSG